MIKLENTDFWNGYCKCDTFDDIPCIADTVDIERYCRDSNHLADVIRRVLA